MTAPRCPECAQGKHRNCAGWAFNDADEWVPCMCPDASHDPEEEA